MLAIGAASGVFAVSAAVAKVQDPDVWWIAAAGRDLLASGRVPRENAYAFTDPAHPWIMHEWLFAAPFAQGLARAGPAFFALAALAFMLATFALVLVHTMNAPTGLRARGLYSLATLLCFGKRCTSARPSGAALLFAVAMAHIAFRPRLRWRDVALAAAIELVWANAHGSFPLGVALLGAGAACAWWEKRRDDIALRAAAVGIAAAVTPINPYGLKLHRFVLAYFRGEPGVFAAIHEHIAEFAPLWRDTSVLGVPEKLGFAWMTGLALAAIASPRWRARGAVVLGLALLAALHVRHIEQLGLLGAMILAPRAGEIAERLGLRAGRGEAARTRAVAAAMLAVGALALTLHVGARASRDPDDWIDPSLGGRSFVRLARAVPDGARVYAPFESSGLLLWLASQRGVRVYHDPRNDCFSRAVTDDAIALLAPDATAESRLLDRGTDFVLSPASSPLRDFLGAWKPTAADGDWLLLEAPPRVR